MKFWTKWKILWFQKKILRSGSTATCRLIVSWKVNSGLPATSLAIDVASCFCFRWHSNFINRSIFYREFNSASNLLLFNALSSDRSNDFVCTVFKNNRFQDDVILWLRNNLWYSRIILDTRGYKMTWTYFQDNKIFYLCILPWN